MPSIRTISVSGSIPSITQLALGDLAVNTYDGKAYLKKQQGTTQTVVEIGAGSGTTSGVTQIIPGTNITISPVGGTGVVTINATAPTSASYALSSSYALSTSYATTASTAITSQNILVYCKNQTGFDIIKGTVVRITGSNNSSDIPRITTASYTDDTNSANTLGITNETIINGDQGYVMTEGVLLGVDTSNYTSGQLLFLGLSGSITGSAPVAPLHAVRLGEVIRQQSNNGSIYVRIDNGYELDELHDVKITSPNSGDLLIRSASVWINSKQLTGSYGLTGSLTATSVTSSLFGTSSYATQAGNTNTININSFGSPVDSYLLMSNVVATTGVAIGGDNELRYNSSTNVLTVPSITSSFTGSLLGTASYASVAQTASYILNAISSSYATTSSFPWFQTGSNIAYIGGNVGIGETNPRTKFTMQGSAGGYWIFIDRGNTTEGGNTPTWGVLNNVDPASATYGWAWYDSSNDGSFSLWRRNASTTASLVVKFDRSNSNTYFAANVVITGSSTNSLLVKGSGTTSATIGFRVENSSGTGLFVVRNDGFVGIGTTVPSDNLTVIGTTSLYGGTTSITGATSGSGYSLIVRNSALNNALLITNVNSSSFGGNVDISGNLNANSTASMRRFQSGFFNDLHPESGNNSILPFYSNDIAYNTLRGGQFTASFGSGSTYTLSNAQIEALFDGSSTYCAMPTPALSGSMTASIVFPTTFQYGNIIGFSFGSVSWVARDFTVEILVTGSYVTLDTQTNYPYANYSKEFNTSGNNLQGVRITFSNFNIYGGFRIAEIFLLNYNSQLGKAVFVGRDGGAVYKPLTVQSGSTSAPSYASLTNTNTGLYFPTVNTIGFVNNGTENIRLDSTGKLSIGKTFANTTLDILGNLTVTGSITATTITGSLLGTSSWASNSISSSYALTASYVLSGSYALTSSRAVSSSFASTASFANTLNQILIVTGGLAVATGSLGNGESALVVGPAPAGGAGEGGQIALLATGGTYTSASFIDNYQDQFRVLKGQGSTSNAGLLSINLQTLGAKFEGAITASGYSGLPNSYLYVTRNTNQNIGGGNWANQDIIFDTIGYSVGIAYNTISGLASLQGGKVYRITARLAWHAAAVYNLQFSCYDSGNIQLGPTVEMVQSTNGTNNISDGTLDFIYAPGGNTDIKIRTSPTTNALTGEYIRGDLNTQLIIQQIA